MKKYQGKQKKHNKRFLYKTSILFITIIIIAFLSFFGFSLYIYI